MRKGHYEDITTFLVKHTFHTRFFLARLSQKSKIAKKIIDNLLFKGDEVFVLPTKYSVEKSRRKHNNINKSNESKNNNSNRETITTNIEINQSFQKDETEFIPSEILKLAIKEASNIVIMNKCLCRSSAGCEDYPKNLGCIFLGPASRKIPKKYGKTSTVEEALKHVDLADSYGLSHVIGRNKIDTIWMNIGPKEELLTICHCCPCCCLWKVLPDLDKDISNKVMKLEDVKVKTITQNCKKCKKCLQDDICFGNAIIFKDGKIKIDQDKCVGCGHCIHTCEFDGIQLEYTQKSVDSVLNRLGELVDYKK